MEEKTGIEPDEERPKKKGRSKEEYKRPELTKFGPVEEFTAAEPAS